MFNLTSEVNLTVSEWMSTMGESSKFQKSSTLEIQILNLLDAYKNELFQA